MTENQDYDLRRRVMNHVTGAFGIVALSLTILGAIYLGTHHYQVMTKLYLEHGYQRTVDSHGFLEDWHKP